MERIREIVGKIVEEDIEIEVVKIGKVLRIMKVGGGILNMEELIKIGEGSKGMVDEGDDMVKKEDNEMWEKDKGNKIEEENMKIGEEIGEKKKKKKNGEGGGNEVEEDGKRKKVEERKMWVLEVIGVIEKGMSLGWDEVIDMKKRKIDDSIDKMIEEIVVMILKRGM